MPRYAQVIISFATVSEIDRFFTYKIEDHLVDCVAVGSRVKVPFGRGSHYQVGYVIEISDVAPESNYVVKSIEGVVESEPLLNEEQLAIAQFLTKYYGTTFAAAIDVILPPGVTQKPFVYKPTITEYIELNMEPEALDAYIQQNTHKKPFKDRGTVLKYLLQNGQAKQQELMEKLQISASPITTLIKNGVLKKVQYEQINRKDCIRLDLFKTLNSEQSIAKDKIVNAINHRDYRGFLLEGVTGSGKTEVFLHAIRAVIEQGGQAIVLVPEIALTPQTLDRFKERFGNQVALSHSRMSSKERQNLYMQAKKGIINIIIGPRSAIFMPFKNVKLIVIDEEHEGTYKSEVTPKYSAIEIAKMRMMRSGGVMVLASATPSIESYYLAQIGEYEKLPLKNRIGRALLPNIELVDMRLELKDGNNMPISKKLYTAIQDTLEQNDQVMLLLNRRGHSTFINCRNCGFVLKCKHCDIAMTYHATTRSVECHYCGSKQPIPQVCPSCGSKYIRFFGSGTEKIEEYLMTHFGQYGVGRMDFDTTSGKDGHGKILEAFRSKQINVLVGTQMIAKGHDFPNVTLVGVIAADMSLYMQDFRCDERTFQLLTQVVGRSGRGEKKGKVIIQSYNPEHPVLEMIKYHKQEEFYEQELETRKMMQYPPFTHIFTVLITGKDEKKVVEKAHLLAQYYTYYNKKKLFRVIGPVAAVVSRVADEYRWRILIIGVPRDILLMYGKYCIEQFHKKEDSENVKIQWDIDPMTML